MFAIVGVASFGKNDPFYFGDLGECNRFLAAAFGLVMFFVY